MKLKILIILTAIVAIFGWRVLAQTNNQTTSPQKTIQSFQYFLPWPPDPKNYSIVNGKLFSNSSDEWVKIPDGYTQRDLEVLSLGKKISIVCSVYDWPSELVAGIYGPTHRIDDGRDFSKNILIYNYPDQASLVTGQKIECRCIRVGNYVENGHSLEAYDIGLPDTIENRKKAGLPIPTTEQIAVYREQILTVQKLAFERANAAKKAKLDKVLKYHQDLADKGDSFGLLRMGERYRDGDGVPKDLSKAREYLSKAATAVLPRRRYAKITNQVSTNSPATR